MVETAQLVTMGANFNPRVMPEIEMANLRASLRQWGPVQPVVVNQRTRRIVGGHQRVLAAQAEGIAQMPVHYVDLDELSEKQLNLALNRISGEWDNDLLGKLLNEIGSGGGDLTLTGFDGKEVDRLLAALAATKVGLVDEDSIPEPPDTPITQRGDMIQLGVHRLLCADSSDPQLVSLLCGNAPVQMVNTDPPYNVKVEPRSNNAIAAGKGTKGNVPNSQRERMHHQGLDLARRPGAAKPTGKMRAKDRALENDFVTDDAFEAMLGQWFGNAAQSLAPGRSFYIWGGYSNIKNYPKALVDAGLFFSQAIIWDKQWPVLTRKDFMGAHEWCFYGWREGAAHWFNPKIKNATDLWHVKKVPPTAMQHLTEKPVELAELAMTYSSQASERVLDLFGGSGSTLIAAEKLGRTALLMELDPAYCDVICQRYTEFTGKAVRREKAA